MKPSWRLTRGFILPILHGVFGLEVHQIENVPKSGPLIVCTNHGSYWDPILLGAVMPREIYFVAKEELFTTFKPFGWLISKYNAIPIKREAGGLSAIKTTLRLLKDGRAVIVFPEGTRNRTGTVLLPLKAGAAILSHMSGAPILPGYIKNNRKGMGNWMIRNGSPVIRFGKLIHPENFPNDKKGTKMTEYLESELRRLAQELGLRD